MDKKEKAVIMVILPPWYYMVYCMRTGCENSLMKKLKFRCVIQSAVFVKALPSLSIVFLQLILHYFVIEDNCCCIKTKKYQLDSEFILGFYNSLGILR